MNQPSSFFYIAEFDRVADRIRFDTLIDHLADLLEQRQERDLIRRANQSECALLKLQS